MANDLINRDDALANAIEETLEVETEIDGAFLAQAVNATLANAPVALTPAETQGPSGQSSPDGIAGAEGEEGEAAGPVYDPFIHGALNAEGLPIEIFGAGVAASAQSDASRLEGAAPIARLTAQAQSLGAAEQALVNAVFGGDVAAELLTYDAAPRDTLAGAVGRAAVTVVDNVATPFAVVSDVDGLGDLAAFVGRTPEALQTEFVAAQEVVHKAAFVYLDLDQQKAELLGELPGLLREDEEGWRTGLQLTTLVAATSQGAGDYALIGDAVHAAFFEALAASGVSADAPSRADFFTELGAETVTARSAGGVVLDAITASARAFGLVGAPEAFLLDFKDALVAQIQAATGDTTIPGALIGATEFELPESFAPASNALNVQAPSSVSPLQRTQTLHDTLNTQINRIETSIQALSNMIDALPPSELRTALEEERASLQSWSSDLQTSAANISQHISNGGMPILALDVTEQQLSTTVGDVDQLLNQTTSFVNNTAIGLASDLRERGHTDAAADLESLVNQGGDIVVTSAAVSANTSFYAESLSAPPLSQTTSSPSTPGASTPAPSTTPSLSQAEIDYHTDNLSDGFRGNIEKLNNSIVHLERILQLELTPEHRAIVEGTLESLQENKSQANDLLYEIEQGNVSAENLTSLQNNLQNFTEYTNEAVTVTNTSVSSITNQLALLSEQTGDNAGAAELRSRIPAGHSSIEPLPSEATEGLPAVQAPILETMAESPPTHRVQIGGIVITGDPSNGYSATNEQVSASNADENVNTIPLSEGMTPLTATDPVYVNYIRKIDEYLYSALGITSDISAFENSVNWLGALALSTQTTLTGDGYDLVGAEVLAQEVLPDEFRQLLNARNALVQEMNEEQSNPNSDIATAFEDFELKANIFAEKTEETLQVLRPIAQAAEVRGNTIGSVAIGFGRSALAAKLGLTAGASTTTATGGNALAGTIVGGTTFVASYLGLRVPSQELAARLDIDLQLPPLHEELAVTTITSVVGMPLAQVIRNPLLLSAANAFVETGAEAIVTGEPITLGGLATNFATELAFDGLMNGSGFISNSSTTLLNNGLIPAPAPSNLTISGEINLLNEASNRTNSAPFRSSEFPGGTSASQIYREFLDVASAFEDSPNSNTLNNPNDSTSNSAEDIEFDLLEENTLTNLERIYPSSNTGNGQILHEFSNTVAALTLPNGASYVMTDGSLGLTQILEGLPQGVTLTGPQQTFIEIAASPDGQAMFAEYAKEYDSLDEAHAGLAGLISDYSNYARSGDFLGTQDLEMEKSGLIVSYITGDGEERHQVLSSLVFGQRANVVGTMNMSQIATILPDGARVSGVSGMHEHPLNRRNFRTQVTSPPSFGATSSQYGETDSRFYQAFGRSFSTTGMSEADVASNDTKLRKLALLDVPMDRLVSLSESSVTPLFGSWMTSSQNHRILGRTNDGHLATRPLTSQDFRLGGTLSAWPPFVYHPVLNQDVPTESVQMHRRSDQDAHPNRNGITVDPESYDILRTQNVISAFQYHSHEQRGWDTSGIVSPIELLDPTASYGQIG
ncbi:MAG: hypothetical protein AAGM38_14610, partial [Pseudomonadota bacterium]